MTEAEEKKLEVAERDRKDRERKDTNEEIPAWADSFMDRLEKRMDARLDAIEKRYRKDEEGEERRPEEAADKRDRKDREERDRKDKDLGEDPTETSEGKKREDRKDRKDESAEERERDEKEGGHKANEERWAKEREEKDRKDREARDRKDEGDRDTDSDREDRARKDAALQATTRQQAAKIAELEARLNAVYREPTIEDRNALAEVRNRADSVYQALTGQPASQPMPGETPISYRKRLADGLRKFSDSMKEVRLDSLSGPALDVIEERIYKDAMEALKAPAHIPSGQLRAITRNDSGHQITEYVGDPKVAFADFAAGSSVKVKLTRPQVSR